MSSPLLQEEHREGDEESDSHARRDALLPTGSRSRLNFLLVGSGDLSELLENSGILGRTFPSPGEVGESLVVSSLRREKREEERSASGKRRVSKDFITHSRYEPTRRFLDEGEEEDHETRGNWEVTSNKERRISKRHRVKIVLRCWAHRFGNRWGFARSWRKTSWRRQR